MKERLEQAEGYWNRLLIVLEEYWKDLIIALPRIAFAILLFFIAWFIAVKVKQLLLSRLTKKAHDPLFARFVAQLTKMVIIIVGLLLVLQVVGLSGIASGLLAGAGVSALVFGFAFKDIAENFLAGIILAFNRPFSMHDAIKVEDYLGYVVALGFRSTHIKTFDEKDVFIPNATIVKQPITNLTMDGLLRMDFVVGIAYEDDIQNARTLILKIIQDTEGVLLSKEPFVVVDELATNTVNLKIFFWTDTKDYRKGVLLTKSTVIEKVKKSLSENGISLPANIQELKLYDKADAIPVKLTNSEKQ